MTCRSERGTEIARIVVIRHRYEPQEFSSYTMGAVTTLWREAGHDVQVVRGIEDLPEADLAILHVNLSVVPPDYLAAARRYRRVVNGAALDIRKRTVSRQLLARGEPWGGPVIVKSNLNYAGWPEVRIALQMLQQGLTPIPAHRPIEDYPIYPSVDAVPESTWRDRRLVIERFLPERDERGFHVRTWIFLGSEGVCKRVCSPHPVVKGEEIVSADDCDVPPGMFEERRRLGMDFGKFDFVVHEGRPILLDANKTPGFLPGVRLYPRLAAALDGLLGDPAPAR